MYELDKKKFGAFVALLRKENGLTQKQLAERLLISDKAISKWETGTTLPDTAMLIPLADILGVTVTELLTGERIENESLLPETVEDIVKTAIAYNEATPTRAWSEKGPWGIMYALGCLIGAICLFLLYQRGQMTQNIITSSIITAIFGAYFCFFVRIKLPVYYDQNKISAGVHDGIFRMNVPGLHFNNSNWPYIVKTGRVVMLAIMVLFPVLALIVSHVNRELWIEAEKYVMLVLLLGGLVVPVYIVGKKYE